MLSNSRFSANSICSDAAGIAGNVFALVMVATGNRMGVVFQAFYVIAYIAYASEARKKLVIKTRKVEYMPSYLSLSAFLTGLSFLACGLFKADPFIYFPNGIGTILGASQLGLYSYYKNASTEDLREPFMNSCA